MKPTVILLHGLGRTHRSLARLQRAIAAAGYPTWSRTYPSRTLGIVDLAAQVAQQIREEVPAGPMLAVTHSLGGILVRHMTNQFSWLGAVMIAPPNQGSRVARELNGNPLFRWFSGTAGEQLGDCSRWPDPPQPLHIIAGNLGRSLSNPVSWLTSVAGWFDDANASDGTVAVAETKHPSATEHVIVRANHTWIMNHPSTRDHVLQSLALMSA